MKTINKTQQGFTLVELIIVIVILGILAVTAAPRFLNFTQDARLAVLDSVAGAIKAGNALVYGKAAIAGQTASELSCYEPASQTVIAPTGTTPACSATAAKLVYGYLAADKDAFARALSLSDFVTKNSTDTTTVAVVANTLRLGGSESEVNPATIATGCYVVYAQSTAKNVEPVITPTIAGCN